MEPSIGKIVHVRAGAYCVQDRCAAIITRTGSGTLVDLTVFPGNRIDAFALKSVDKAEDDYLEASNKEIFWHWPP